VAAGDWERREEVGAGRVVGERGGEAEEAARRGATPGDGEGCGGGRRRSDRERQNLRALMQRGGSAGGRRDGRTVRHWKL
jgi:hypothetical protein